VSILDLGANSTLFLVKEPRAPCRHGAFKSVFLCQLTIHNANLAMHLRCETQVVRYCNYRPLRWGLSHTELFCPIGTEVLASLNEPALIWIKPDVA
jgi:hypothetical protein